MARVRLDALLVMRGLAASRERARRMILAGEVRVAGQPAPKAGLLVADDAEVALARADHPFVSRGGVKLAGALDAFGVAVEGRLALDIGASTGGFTDVLLRRGAARVVALDVGHGQLDWRLRQDPRVVVVERVNARTLDASAFPPALQRFGIITVDVSFIAVRAVLPGIVSFLQPDGDLIVLVKPQFEAGRADVGRGGIVRDPAVHARVLEAVAEEAERLGLAVAGQIASPITGAEGNREFFLHLRRTGRA